MQEHLNKTKVGPFSYQKSYPDILKENHSEDEDPLLPVFPENNQTLMKERKENRIDDFSNWERNQNHHPTDLNDDFEFPYILLVKESYWNEITFFSTDAVHIDMRVFINKNWQKICVYLYISKLKELLGNCEPKELSLLTLGYIDIRIKKPVINDKINLLLYNKKYLKSSVPFAAVKMRDEEEMDEEDQYISSSTYMIT